MIINGITLIALVITIIVLLILAGVTIATLTGNNGILTRANDAKEKTEQAQRNEESILKDYEEMINGNYIEIEQVTDENPGVLEGNGTDTDPYIINSIEDLVYFANQVKSGITYSNQYVELGLSLDFNSEKSYGSNEKRYLLNEEKMQYEETTNGGKSLKELLMNGLGWMPIGDTKDSNKSFKGTFDGKENVIKNLYINNKV